MERIMQKEQLIDELSSRTKFFKHNIKSMLDALDDIIVENMSMATEDEPSEIRLSLGFVFGGRYRPEQLVKDPRNGEMVVSAARIIPYAKFSPNFRKKINKNTKKNKKRK